MTEDEFLRSFAQKENQISRTPIPSKRQVRTFVERRKGHRMTSDRMMKVLRQQTPDSTRAIYQTPKKAAAAHAGIDVPPTPFEWAEGHAGTTRNVGPSDLPRSTSGKQTIGMRTY